MMQQNQKKLDLKKVLFKGLVFVAVFYLFFSIVYFVSKPVKINSFFGYLTVFIYAFSIIVMAIELIKNVKKDKWLILVMLLLAVIFLMRFKATHGAMPYRDIVYVISLKIAQTNFGVVDLDTIRFFGMGVLIKLSQLIFNKISWDTFTYISYLINFLGLIAVYLISKKIYKKTAIAVLSPILILLNFWVLYYLGNEEFSGFAVSFLMIAYYFMLERKPLTALITFLAAAFSRTEVFLLFPFFIAQYWYVNNIDFNIKKELKRIKKLPLKKTILSATLITILCVEVWFLVTNLVSFYSLTSQLELFGPQPKGNKEIFNYLYYHLTYQVTSRIASNVSFLATQTFLQNSFELGSIILFSLFILSSLLGLKDKKIQILLFNILFFFVLYVIIRYDGFTDGYYRYTIFVIYPMAIIIPYSLKVLIKRGFKSLVKLSCILIAFIIIAHLFSQIRALDDNLSPYQQFTKEELKQIYSNLSQDCKFAFLTGKHPLILYLAPPKMEILPFSLSKSYLHGELNELKSKEKCLYVIIPTTARSISFPDFYDQARDEGWCKDETECDLKLNNRMEILEQLNFTRILSFNKSESDLGGIYYWENQNSTKII